MAVGSAVAAALVGLLGVSGCSTSAKSTDSSGDRVVQVAASINAWGSILAQLGGTHVRATSIITNPDTDPHDYEPSTGDGRTIARSQLFVKNGIGYDSWATKSLAASPDPSRLVIDVGELVHVPDGGNPHRWYSPADVRRVIDAITADYQRIDPADAAYFAAQRSTFENRALAQYNSLIAGIRARYSGTPIGASESIVTPRADGLGLRLLTPATFLDAISEGSDPTAADKATIDNQIRTRQIKLYVYNSQNSTPDVQAQVDEARAAGIPVTAVTETLAPANATFQAWQVRQLEGIEQALHEASGK
jgi:zinc/manganese transport system substrate-binding protein